MIIFTNFLYSQIPGVEGFIINSNANVVGKSLAESSQKANIEQLLMTGCEITKQELENFVQNLRANKKVTFQL